MNVRVTMTRTAGEQARVIDNWWRANRTAAPLLFVQELSSAVEMLGRFPRLGRKIRMPGGTRVQRFLMVATRNHVYYRFDGEQVVIVAIWHAVRGTGPDLAET
jgi:plasmid stabilization system protein ParE